ncbi:MAG: VOC family protein [Gemmatimonadaceae bacterium]|nr:VOC family protein [Gemmatimonadaceae bacterium]
MPDFRKITTVLAVDSVEASLDFWQRRLGFEVTVTVPHEDHVGFAILARDGTELMLQSVASIRADLGGVTGEVHGRSAALFIEVASLEAVEQALAGYPIAMPRRTTFYGMHEIGVREPGGHFVVFAQPA